LVSPPFQKRRARTWRALFFFYSIKFRIAGSEEKTANFPGVEVLFYQCLLLWINGGNLTKQGVGNREQGIENRRHFEGEPGTGNGDLATGRRE
jgi:hypothetical protein